MVPRKTWVSENFGRISKSRKRHPFIAISTQLSLTKQPITSLMKMQPLLPVPVPLCFVAFDRSYFEGVKKKLKFPQNRGVWGEGVKLFFYGIC